MKHLTAILSLALAACLIAGCATTTTTNTDGTTTTSKTVDWTTVDYTVQKSVKYTVVLVLNNNPDYATAVAAINTGLSALLVGTPTEASLITAIKAMETNLDDANITLIAGVLKDACDLYFAKSGKTTLLASDETVQGIVKAISDGIAEGVTLHNASTSTTSA